MTNTLSWAVLDRTTLSARATAAERGCLVVGPAGIGKSTLVRVALERERRPFVVVHGFEGLTTVPFAALSGARSEQPDRPDEFDPDIVRRMRGWLQTLVASGTTVVVDDADLLDPPSSGLLSYAAQTEGLRLIATMRAERQLPSDLERLALHQAWPTVTVTPWSQDEIERAVRETLGGAVDPVLAASLHELSQGVPLVVRELVLDGVARDRIRAEDGRWQGTPSVGSPESAARLLGRRLPASGPPLVALQALAIAGQLRAAVLDRMVSRAVVADLERQGFLEIPLEEHQLYVRLSHPMLADALREGSSSAERRALLRTIVQSARRLDGEQDADRRQYLRWSLEIGDELTTAELRDGYRTALRGLDYALAADIAGALGDREPSAEAALFHAVALARAGRFDEAVKIADAARPLAVTDDEVVALARFLVRLHSPVGHSVGFHGGRDDRAMAVAAWADGRIGLPAFAGLLDIFTAFVGGDLDRSVTLATALSTRCAAALSGVHEEIDQFLVMAAPLTGRFDVGRTSQRRLADGSHAGLGIPAIMGAHGARVSLLMYDGRLREAYDEDDRALTQARDALAYDEMMQAAGQRGLRAFLLGDLDGAVESLDLSLQYRVVPHSRSLLIRGALAATLALRGEHDRAREVVAETDLERAQFPTQMLQLDYDHLRGLALGLAGEVEGPEKAIRTAADRAQTSGYHWLHVFARLSLVRMGRAQAEDAVRASKTLALVDAPLIRSVAEVVIAAVEGDRGALATLADQLAAMEANLFAVDALRALLSTIEDAEAASGPAATSRSAPDRGTIEHQLAEVLRRCPGLDLAQARLALADGGRAVDEADPSASDGTGPARSRLSPRELEIATLAAAGMTSKEIGDRLELSPRTVDNTLRRVYAKLAIGGRRDLADAMGA